MLRLKLQYFSHLMGRADSLEKTPMLGKTEGRRRGRQRMRRLDGTIGTHPLKKCFKRWFISNDISTPSLNVHPWEMSSSVTAIARPKYTTPSWSKRIIWLDPYLACSVTQSCLTLCNPMNCPLSMEFSREESWRVQPFLSPGNLTGPGIEPTSLVSPALASGFFITFTTAPPGKPQFLALFGLYI